MTARKLTLAIIVTLCALIAALALGCVSALGARQYVYETQITGAMLGEPFGRPWSLTFDAAGNLYVADSTQSIVDKFDSTNAFQAQLGLGVLTGGDTRGVAVDNETGDVFVGDTKSSRVFVLKANGEQLSPPWTGANTTEKTFTGSMYVAVDNSTSVSKGDIYVLTQHHSTSPATYGEVDVFEPQNKDKEEGKFLRRLVPPGGFANEGRSGIAVDDFERQHSRRRVCRRC